MLVDAAGYQFREGEFGRDPDRPHLPVPIIFALLTAFFFFWIIIEAAVILLPPIYEPVTTLYFVCPRSSLEEIGCVYVVACANEKECLFLLCRNDLPHEQSCSLAC